ncbi:MAG: SAM-dependent methyltransferase [Oscillospiraceae bacterium]|nr:SAM-dependent methyltransferase [Oscillospiraceae bacterium]
MNRRLSAIMRLIDSQVGVIDVGTDHGYIPVALAQQGFGGKLYASDIHEAPLNTARKTAADAGVSDRISFQRCDGLTMCPPEEVDCIVIAGMGGDMIVKILDEAEWCMQRRYQLVLQPMTKAEVVRYWLAYNEFTIEKECLVEDAGTLYQVIVARFGGQTILSDAELFIGKQTLHEDKDLFARFLNQTAGRFEKMLEGMSTGDGSPDGREHLYRAILKELYEMREKS